MQRYQEKLIVFPEMGDGGNRAYQVVVEYGQVEHVVIYQTSTVNKARRVLVSLGLSPHSVPMRAVREALAVAEMLVRTDTGTPMPRLNVVFRN